MAILIGSLARVALRLTRPLGGDSRVNAPQTFKFFFDHDCSDAPCGKRLGEASSRAAVTATVLDRRRGSIGIVFTRAKSKNRDQT